MVGEGEDRDLVFHGDRVPVRDDESVLETMWGWWSSRVNVLNATEPFPEKG